jgi:hypothetical protein
LGFQSNMDSRVRGNDDIAVSACVNENVGKPQPLFPQPV